MNKFKFISFAFALLLGVSFVSCDNDDTPEYEQVIINQAASAGLIGSVKSVETISYGSSYDAEADAIIISDPFDKRITDYDKKGKIIGYEYYDVYGENKFRLDWKSETQYDNRYRETYYCSESYFYNGDNDAIEFYRQAYRAETVYDDSKKMAIVSIFYWDADAKKYVFSETRIHPLNSNGTVNEDVYTSIGLRAASEVEKIDFERERVIVEKDAKGNWTKAYSKSTAFDEDGNVYFSSMYGYQERTIVYY